MFVYIDESGHTGKDSKNPDQPIFRYLAVASMYSIDLDSDGSFSSILAKNSISEIHGAENFDKIESFALDILDILEKNSISCFYSVIEKDFMVYAKLYDILFDNVENEGARFEAYQIREFRVLLLDNLIEITPVSVAHRFYEECLFAKSKADAVTVLKETCEIMLSRVHMLKDKTAITIISQAANWALNNPTELTTFHTRKIDRWTHLPHVASFLPLMNMLSNYSESKKSPIIRIMHDEQRQLEKVLVEIHKFSADPETPDILDLGENGKISLQMIKNTHFEIRDSSSSYGLQIADICLYLLGHEYDVEGKATQCPNTFRLIQYLREHVDPFELTYRLHCFELYMYNIFLNQN
ncbi:DUF3800 domain-containing protein [uncultured Sphaerochaeta sp.]|jgi:hypothetical protein|uniref:DUF3800 domain-containing protein n=1 Tax=uncultured Sphaerochaeta sp. TaxID=886478 RepID=UPI002AA8A811|nr:DUF3800 domain-containing protein [uncultured Sphaerochaeta sp.]